jgi:hypothetical protein
MSIITSVKYFDRRPPQRRQRRASDGPATAVVQGYIDNQSFENGQNGDILFCLKF